MNLSKIAQIASHVFKHLVNCMSNPRTKFFARHHLATRRQKPSETLVEFLQEL